MFTLACPAHCYACNTDYRKCDDENCANRYYKKAADGLCSGKLCYFSCNGLKLFLHNYGQPSINMSPKTVS